MTGNLNECPCHGCEAPKRQPGCHAVCPEYKEWNEARQVLLDKIRQTKLENDACFPTYTQQCAKLKKQKRRVGYGHNTTD